MPGLNLRREVKPLFDRVLVPLDGSRLAEAILPYVSELAGRLGARIVLLSVVGDEWPSMQGRVVEGTGPDTGKPMTREELARRAEAQALAYLERVKASLPARTEAVVAFGRPAETIVKEQERLDCDLIAMSTQGRTGVQRGILGSVTDKVLHSTTVPMLVFRPPDEGQAAEASVSIGTVVVPLDGSELSESVLPYAEELARRLGLEIVLVESVSLMAEDVFFGEFYFNPTPIERELLMEADKYLKGIVQRLQARGLRASSSALLDVPARAIVRFARETPGSIIAMSTRGRSGVTRWLLGSVTEKVVRESGVPVLVVPASRAGSPA